MKKWCQFVSSSISALFLLSQLVSAQENEPDPSVVPEGKESAASEVDSPAGQEVEINEDNYRQFMELRDAMQQRDIIPENVFKPGSGLQKLEKLPEESQKHLRNQLREIIVQGEPWQPGDEDKEYPYTPSVAASTDTALEKQELEAWGELVDGYNDRESQIYENSSGSQAARGSEQGSSNNPQNGKGQPGGNGQNNEGAHGQQAGQEGDADQAENEGTYSLNGSSDQNAENTAGVSQNAMQFLQGLGNGGASETQTGNGTAAQSGDQGDSPAPSEAQAQNGQKDGAEQGSSPAPASDPNATSTAGTSQNAMEFLKGSAGQGQEAGEGGTASDDGNEGQGEAQDGNQGEGQADGQAGGQDDGAENGEEASEESGENDGADDADEAGQEGDQAGEQGDGQADGQGDEQAQDAQQTETPEDPDTNIPPATADPASPAESEEESTAGASQNALEYLTGEGDQPDEGTNNDANTGEPAGTLTIQDLLNAQGVGDSTGTNPASSRPDDEQQPHETIPDKDGG